MACVILGAGAGTRFGEPKAGARLRSGQRFVDAVANAAREAGIQDIVAVLPESIIPPDGVRRVINRNATGEQIESLRLGLALLTNSPVQGALAWPVDHPFVMASTIRAVVDAVRTGEPLIAIPSFQGKHGHPVYFSRDVWRELMTVPDGGARAVTHAFANDVLDVPVDDAGVMRNVDTQKDLA